MISTIVLPARGSRQAAEQNPPLPLENKPVLRWLLENVLASEADEVICVTDDLTAARREIQMADSRLIWHFDSAAVCSQSTSVVAGLWASHPKSDGVILVAGELPLVRKEWINALIARFKNCPAAIIVGSSNEQPANPVLFRRELYPELLKLTGDDRGLSLIKKHSEKTALIEWQEEYGPAPNLCGF